MESLPLLARSGNACNEGNTATSRGSADTLLLKNSRLLANREWGNSGGLASHAVNEYKAARRAAFSEAERLWQEGTAARAGFDPK